MQAGGNNVTGATVTVNGDVLTVTSRQLALLRHACRGECGHLGAGAVQRVRRPFHRGRRPHRGGEPGGPRRRSARGPRPAPTKAADIDREREVELVVATLTDRITAGELKAGQAVSIAASAAELGVTRSRVEAAVSALVKAGRLGYAGVGPVGALSVGVGGTGHLVATPPTAHSQRPDHQ
jgi:hypothetical protein